MKPPPFEYHAPVTLDEAVSLLAEHGEEARILAGGQTLVPTMNFRLARPAHIVDINGISALDYVKQEGNVLRIGALVRHSTFERPVTSGVLSRLLPLMASHIAHWPIRTRGTFCGSIAHADPASEWCLAAVTLGAEVVLRSTGGERVLPVSRFITGALMTALQDDEIVVETRLPLPSSKATCGFREFSRRAGDFALAMACAVVTVEAGQISDVRLGVGGATEKPLRVEAAEEALCGQTADPGAADLAAKIVSEEIDPIEDLHGDAEYRRDIAAVMARRAILSALGT